MWHRASEQRLAAKAAAERHQAAENDAAVQRIVTAEHEWCDNCHDLHDPRGTCPTPRLADPEWLAYAVATRQWGFLATAVAYGVVYSAATRPFSDWSRPVCAIVMWP